MKSGDSYSAPAISADLFQDLRHGLRLIRKHAGFTVVAVAVLAIGIGANTAIFSIVDTLLFRPLAYEHADRIVTIFQRNLNAGGAKDDVAPANFLDWRERSRSFEVMAASDPYSFDYTGGSEPESLFAMLVTEGFFEAAGARPRLGRTFRPEEHQQGRHRVVVISDGFWRRRFGADPHIIGRVVSLDQEAYTIVGVMPRNFQLGILPRAMSHDIWAPKVIQEYEPRLRGSAFWNVIARRKPGITTEQAQAEMDTIAAALAREYPRTNREVGVLVLSLRDHLAGSIRTALFVLLGAVGVVLLIACANIANLLLVRGSQREREFAIRAALGAGRARLMRQLLAENVLLATLGGAAGLLVARWGIRLIVSLTPVNVPGIDQVALDARVLAFAAVLTLSTALLFGLSPSLQFSRKTTHDPMKEGRSMTASVPAVRLRRGLVAAEVGLALVLLTGAGLLLRSFMVLTRVDPGFAGGDIYLLQAFTGDRQTTPERRVQFFRETLDRLRGVPGVESAGAVMAMPFIESNINIESPLRIEGRPAPPPQDEPSTFVNIATPDVFRTLGIPLRRGRFFTDRDAGDAPPVALVNDTLARRYWADRDPIGQRITVTMQGRPRTADVVGIVGELRHDGLDQDPRPEVFLPHAQLSWAGMVYVIRASPNATISLQSLKEQIWAIDKMQAFYRTATLDELVAKSLAERRFSLWLLGAFAALALVLAAVGIYGVISFATSQRTHEIGIRMALGAKSEDITRMVVANGMTPVGIGVGLGLTGALILSRFMTRLLFGISPRDVVTFAAVSVLLVIVALVACYVPARRATRIDPIATLREG
ncbi:MAG: ABC transporter permease [Acidobacteria bacterium]|nr:ABC transporter permease [Acidobacteriota bacterium]